MRVLARALISLGDFWDTNLSMHLLRYLWCFARNDLDNTLLGLANHRIPTRVVEDLIHRSVGEENIYRAVKLPDSLVEFRLIPKIFQLQPESFQVLQLNGARERWEHGLDTPGFGADFKHALRDYGPWKLRILGFGECLPSAGNYLEIDPEVKDKWGVPAIRVHMTYGENELALMKDAAQSAAEMLDASGASDIETFAQTNRPGLAIHEMGTVRMGRDPKTSVLNAHNQAHDVPNLFVADGACMTSSSCVNPSITYMALTARACDYAAKQLDLGNIE